MKIGIDIMGGDNAPAATIEGALLASKALPPEAKLVLIGDSELIKESLKKASADPGDFEISHAPEVMGMGEHPTKAFSQKPQSSLAVGFKLLAESKIDGFASAGNTGAMMVGSMFSVKSIPGVLRPCVTSILPKQDGSLNIILDVGLNADCKPEVLYQFGMLGSLMAEHLYGIHQPKVALLNIGEEEEKGSILTQAAYKLMKESKDFNFVGNAEGRDLFNNKADVIVCDGFTGNVVLKEAEAFYRLIKKRGISDEYFDKFNYELYGGSAILGVNSTVVVGHGISNATAIKNMILFTNEIAKVKLAQKIKEAFKEKL
jgi:phosphate acyltransferase